MTVSSDHVNTQRYAVHANTINNFMAVTTVLVRDSSTSFFFVYKRHSIIFSRGDRGLMRMLCKLSLEFRVLRERRQIDPFI